MFRSTLYYEMKSQVQSAFSMDDIRETFKAEENNVEADILEDQVPGQGYYIDLKHHNETS